jgi:hypothetical protein
LGECNSNSLGKKGHVLFERGIITKKAKREWDHLKIFFSRTTTSEKLKFTQNFPDIL